MSSFSQRVVRKANAPTIKFRMKLTSSTLREVEGPFYVDDSSGQVLFYKDSLGLTGLGLILKDTILENGDLAAFVLLRELQRCGRRISHIKDPVYSVGPMTNMCIPLSLNLNIFDQQARIGAVEATVTNVAKVNGDVVKQLDITVSCQQVRTDTWNAILAEVRELSVSETFSDVFTFHQDISEDWFDSCRTLVPSLIRNMIMEWKIAMSHCRETDSRIRLYPTELVEAPWMKMRGTLFGTREHSLPMRLQYQTKNYPRKEADLKPTVELTVRITCHSDGVDFAQLFFRKIESCYRMLCADEFELDSDNEGQ